MLEPAKILETKNTGINIETASILGKYIYKKYTGKEK